MRTTLTLIASILLQHFPLSAQPKWSFPLRPGDIHVYSAPLPRTTWWKHVLDVKTVVQAPAKYGNTDGNNDTVSYLQTNQAWSGYGATINSRGMVAYTTSDARYSYEVYPAFPPQTDRFALLRKSMSTIDSTIHTVTRRFDTTIFGKRVSAFTVDGNLTIADHFGVVREVRDDTLTLSSAVISGIEYNRQNGSWRMMPLCRGNEYRMQVIREMRPWEMQTLRIDSDTIAMNQRFWKLHNETTGKNIFLRETWNDVFQLIQGEVKSYLPANAIPGATTDEFIVIDTFSVTMDGVQRRGILTQDHFMWWEHIWIEGIGRIVSTYYGIGHGWDQNDTLVNANVCGVLYNKITSIEAPMEYSFQLSQNFPNPFSNTTSISYSLRQRSHVTLEIFNALGIKIATLVDEEQTAGTHNSNWNPREAGSLLFGQIFFYRLTIDGKTQTRKMLAMP